MKLFMLLALCLLLPLLASAQAPLSSSPSAGTQATITFAADGGGTASNILDCLSFGAVSTTAITSDTFVSVVVRDSTTGSGTILRTYRFALLAHAVGQLVPQTDFCGLNLRGTGGHAMSIEFDSGLTSVAETVSATAHLMN